MQVSVVDGSLIKYFLRNGYRWCLEFDQHKWLHLLVIDYCITSFGFTCHYDWYLYSY